MAKLTERKNGSPKKKKGEHVGWGTLLDGSKGDPCYPVVRRMADTLGKNSTSLELFLTAMLDEIDKQGPGVLLDKVRAAGGECFVKFEIPAPPKAAK